MRSTAAIVCGRFSVFTFNESCPPAGIGVNSAASRGECADDQLKSLNTPTTLNVIPPKVINCCSASTGVSKPMALMTVSLTMTGLGWPSGVLIEIPAKPLPAINWRPYKEAKLVSTQASAPLTPVEGSATSRRKLEEYQLNPRPGSAL